MLNLTGLPLWSFGTFPNQRIGSGVEPHYHDCDETLVFSADTGTVWLADERFAIMPNILVYMPMVVHY